MTSYGDGSNKIELEDQAIAAGGHWSRILLRGQILRIIDVHGHQGVDFLCYNALRTQERYHAPNTIKYARTLKLTKGHALLSDEANPLLTIIADSYGGHDTIGGCCSAPSNQLLYGVDNVPGCRENFLAALTPYGMDRRDIVPNLNFFCHVPVLDDRTLAETVFVATARHPGAHIDLRADMDTLVVISNCPQVNNPCNDGEPSPIRVQVFEGISANAALA